MLSIDLSNYCSKQCPFCYNHSRKEGSTQWTVDEVIAFVTDCIDNGIKAVSLGGGEPLEYDGIFEVIDALYPKCYLSITTNGLPLENERIWSMLIKHHPDKVHITIHSPNNMEEVRRVINQIDRLKRTEIKPGVNLLIGADKVEDAHKVYARLMNTISAEQVILVPQRFSNTPSPKQLSFVADGKPFQSPSCILGCKRPQRFVSVSWDKKVNSCSYAQGKQPLESLSFQGLLNALSNVDFKSCQ